jgi:hypothetical protein
MRTALAALGVVACLATPAMAEDVLFNGTVTSICTILAHTDGTLVLNTNGTQLTSELTSGGLPGTLTVLSIGLNHLAVSAPTRTLSPVAYSATGEVIEVSYAGLNGLSFANQAFTTTATNLTIPNTIAASVLTVNNRITNNNGFPPGTYQTKTTITCAAGP